MNTTLVVTTILQVPYVMMHTSKNITGNSRFYGFCVDLLEKISKQIGFNYILDLVQDRKVNLFSFSCLFNFHISFYLSPTHSFLLQKNLIILIEVWCKRSWWRMEWNGNKLNCPQKKFFLALNFPQMNINFFIISLLFLRHFFLTLGWCPDETRKNFYCNAFSAPLFMKLLLWKRKWKNLNDDSNKINFKFAWIFFCLLLSHFMQLHLSRPLFSFHHKKISKRAWFIIMKHIFLFPSAFPLSYLQFRKQIWLLLQWRSTMRGNLIQFPSHHRYLFKTSNQISF